ncbi:MAG: SDR family NAD(P)-dependent oxidoreductase [Candidatus Marinimicrobia bacterium]|nr:SDR family NAD(P)-dependent oxidoreductase [Candidatus Neomarinimicrobiota bacterium]MCF7851353.1 SDR family NAD(P)-dependent oxidoreductase [Candidatus Neomarinimicrobiota bacterium]MCF7905169.1 SDR family NAD(P)-dependent oxidoreductase [Candidatus Neomarinimicrobiota bacterium]
MSTKFNKILITGASTGIGRQLALDYARMGASIWLLARSEQRLKDLAIEIGTLGGEGHVLVCDATDQQALLSTLDQAQNDSAGFDLVIANAGWGGRMKYPGDNNIHVFNQILDLNFRASIQTLEFFAYQMVQAKQGHLVGVTSIAGFRGLPGSAPYSATKAALKTYMEALRFSVQYYGVKVTDISPGFVRTPMTDKNTIPMPFMIDVDVATKKVIQAIERGRKRFTFPWQMAIIIHLVKAMPDFIFDWIVTRAFTKMAVQGRKGKSEENTTHD